MPVLKHVSMTQGDLDKLKKDTEETKTLLENIKVDADKDTKGGSSDIELQGGDGGF